MAQYTLDQIRAGVANGSINYDKLSPEVQNALSGTRTGGRSSGAPDSSDWGKVLLDRFIRSATAGFGGLNNSGALSLMPRGSQIEADTTLEKLLGGVGTLGGFVIPVGMAAKPAGAIARMVVPKLAAEGAGKLAAAGAAKEAAGEVGKESLKRLMARAAVREGVTGAAYGTAEGLAAGEDAGGVAKNAAMQAALFGITGGAFPAIGAAKAIAPKTTIAGTAALGAGIGAGLGEEDNRGGSAAAGAGIGLLTALLSKGRGGPPILDEAGLHVDDIAAEAARRGMPEEVTVTQPYSIDNPYPTPNNIAYFNPGGVLHKIPGGEEPFKQWVINFSNDLYNRGYSPKEISYLVSINSNVKPLVRNYPAAGRIVNDIMSKPETYINKPNPNMTAPVESLGTKTPNEMFNTFVQDTGSSVVAKQQLKDLLIKNGAHPDLAEAIAQNEFSSHTNSVLTKKEILYGTGEPPVQPQQPAPQQQATGGRRGRQAAAPAPVQQVPQQPVQSSNSAAPVANTNVAPTIDTTPARTQAQLDADRNAYYLINDNVDELVKSYKGKSDKALTRYEELLVEQGIDAEQASAMTKFQRERYTLLDQTNAMTDAFFADVSAKGSATPIPDTLKALKEILMNYHVRPRQRNNILKKQEARLQANKGTVPVEGGATKESFIAPEATTAPTQGELDQGVRMAFYDMNDGVDSLLTRYKGNVDDAIKVYKDTLVQQGADDATAEMYAAFQQQRLNFLANIDNQAIARLDNAVKAGSANPVGDAIADLEKTLRGMHVRPQQVRAIIKAQEVALQQIDTATLTSAQGATRVVSPEQPRSVTGGAQGMRTSKQVGELRTYNGMFDDYVKQYNGNIDEAAVAFKEMRIRNGVPAEDAVHEMAFQKARVNFLQNINKEVDKKLVAAIDAKAPDPVFAVKSDLEKVLASLGVKPKKIRGIVAAQEKRMDDFYRTGRIEELRASLTESKKKQVN